MTITGGAKTAVSTFDNGGCQTEHYRDRMDAVVGILLSSGAEGFEAFVRDRLPSIAAIWRRSREKDTIAKTNFDSFLTDYGRNTGVEMIANERARQGWQEGYNVAHDDLHISGEMAIAAACYANPNLHDPRVKVPHDWPWEDKFWKPKVNYTNCGVGLTAAVMNRDGRIRDLAKAGALIAAELDRLQRIDAKECADNALALDGGE